MTKSVIAFWAIFFAIAWAIGKLVDANRARWPDGQFVHDIGSGQTAIIMTIAMVLIMYWWLPRWRRLTARPREVRYAVTA